MTRKKKPGPAETSPEPERVAESPALVAFREVESPPIVGIGASAGGLEAYRELLGALPGNTGMAFVLVQHLDPTHASMLADLLARATAMRVTEVRDEPAVEANHVYVMPPNRSMVITGGHLKLLPRSEPSGQHRPIDSFLMALAEDQGHRAVGVILSGTGTDGTLGLEAIKAQGGLTFAQDQTAQQDGMPRSAVASGCVDFTLPPERIAEELARIGRHPFVTRSEEPADSQSGGAVSKVLRLLHDASGVDFTHYRSSTLYRRITRRMLLHKLEGLPEYLRFLQGDAAEMDALFRDFLISVTSFFRDPEAFEVLKTGVFPQLLKDRRQRDPVRFWVLGCSTGEEAYSLAIALAEVDGGQAVRIPLQVFAADLNDQGLATARAGLYAKTIAQDVSPERLRRFFVETEGGYQITKQIRDMCVFARQNVLTDPPFSRMDLISCRNLLIYMEPVLQQRIVPLFHFALKPDGFLWLGSSESIGTFSHLFQAKDAKHRIYAKIHGPRPAIGPRLAAPSPSWEPQGQQAATPSGRGTGGDVDLVREADRLALAKYAPPGVLVNAALEILQFRGDTSPYLASAPGKPSVNVLKMAREGLLLGLRAALERAGKEGVAVRQDGLRVKSNGGLREVDLEVLPIRKGAAKERCFLVQFEERSPRARPEPVKSKRAARSPAVDGEGAAPEQTEDMELQNVRLTQELAATREHMQSLIEQQEAANEELQSANEEIQSSNEELQSLNEELQTSKEEIQSSNEELTTVNEELETRNDQLNHLTDDLTNLLSSVQMAIVMVGPDLRIRRFTPVAEKMLNLTASDVGRPIVDVKLSLDIPDLERRLVEVIDAVSVWEVELRDQKGLWYALRMRPYRTLDNRIDGAVILLVDIDAQKRIQASIQEARSYAESIVATVREPLLILDATLHVRTASRAFYQVFGGMPQKTEGRSIYQLGNSHWDIPALRRLLEETLPRDGHFDNFELEHEFEGLGRRVMLLNGRRLMQETTDTELFLLAIEDITERKRLEDELRLYATDLSESDRRKNEFLAMLAHELRNPLAPIANAVRILLLTKGDDEAVGSVSAMMERQIGQIVRLVDDLLDASRISRGKMELRRGRMELASAVNQAVEAARSLVESMDHELTVTLPREPVYLNADPARLAQVVGNVLNNACKFTHTGGRIWLIVDREGEEVVIRVRDNGIGIAIDEIPRIFDMFRQVDTSLGRSVSGLGIGLTLVKTLVEMHEGTVEVHSGGAGQGSEVIIRLPILLETPKPPSTEIVSAPPAITLRILVVDDNRDSAESLANLLELTGNEARSAYDGLEALEAAERFMPDLVLLDIGLPKLNGYEVARRIRELPRGKEMLLVALTGWGQDEARQKSREAGFDEHLVKPVDYAALMKLLSERQHRPG